MLIDDLGYYFGSFEGFMTFLIMIFCLFLSLSIHEFAHGYVAYRLGDNTAKYMGRLSISPFKHLDLLGTVLMIFFGVGWAVPIPINAYNFKGVTQRTGLLLTSIAGPISNFLLAIVAVFVVEVIGRLSRSNLIFAAMLLFKNLAVLNVSFGLFNLIPIPPLDGSRILRVFLKKEHEPHFFLDKFGIFIVVILFQMASFKILYATIVDRILHFYCFLVRLIPL